MIEIAITIILSFVVLVNIGLAVMVAYYIRKELKK